MKKNCWEYMNCGREKGGSMVKEHGICPAANLIDYKGVNGGDYAGRVCWSISGTLCRSFIDGIFAKSIKSCMVCPFHEEVRNQEKNHFTLVVPVKAK